MAKFIVVAIVCLIYAAVAKGRLDETLLTDEFKEVLNKVHETCRKEIDIEDDIIDNTHNGEFPDDPKLKCYMKCVLSNGGAMNDDGTLDYASVEKVIPEGMRDSLKTTFEQCVSQATNDDLCGRAFEFFSCSYKVNPDDYFIN